MHQGRVIILPCNQIYTEKHCTLFCLAHHLPFFLFFSGRETSASLSMSMLCQTRKRNFVNFISRDTAAKEITAFTCTISFTDIIRIFVACNLYLQCYDIFLNSRLQASTRASSFTPVPSVIRETTANSPMML